MCISSQVVHSANKFLHSIVSPFQPHHCAQGGSFALVQLAMDCVLHESLVLRDWMQVINVACIGVRFDGNDLRRRTGGEINWPPCVQPRISPLSSFLSRLYFFPIRFGFTFHSNEWMYLFCVLCFVVQAGPNQPATQLMSTGNKRENTKFYLCNVHGCVCAWEWECLCTYKLNPLWIMAQRKWLFSTQPHSNSIQSHHTQQTARVFAWKRCQH